MTPKYVLILIVIAALLVIASGIWVATALISEMLKSKADSERIITDMESENQAKSA